MSNTQKEVTGSMVNLLKRRLRSRRGQSILEYLVITTVIVLAILAIRAVVNTNTQALYEEAGNKINEATGVLNTFAVTAR